MSGKGNAAVRALLIVAGVVVLLFLAVQLVLNSRIVDRLVDKYAAEYVDGKLDYSRIRVSLIRSFPSVSLSIDSLSLTYPHDRFAAWDTLGVQTRMRRMGRSEAGDTLASFDRLSLSVNPLPLISGRIRVNRVGLRRLRAFARVYDDSTANWNMFLIPESEKDTTSETSVPPISLGSLRISGTPRIYYIDQADTVFASLRMNSLLLKGDVDFTDGGMRLSKALFQLDSLHLRGRIPADTLSADIDYFSIDEGHFNLYDVSLAARAVARTGSYGRLSVPLHIDGRVGFEMHPGQTDIDIRRLEANLAHIPFSARGRASLCGDSTYVDGTLKIDNCPLDTLISDYARAFTTIADDLVTNARLNVDATAKGSFTASGLPQIDACVTIPSGHVYYKPLDLGATLDIDVDGSLSPKKVLSANIENFYARTKGLRLKLYGSSDNILASNPRIKARADGFADLDSLMRLLPADSGIDAGGRLDINLNADAHISEFNQYKFRNASLTGSVTGDRIVFRMPEDTIGVVAYKPYVAVNSNLKGIVLDANLDSALVAIGRDMRARVRGMKNHGYMRKVETDSGKMASRFDVTSENSSVFFRSGPTRAMVRKVDLAASVQRRVQDQSARRNRRNHVLDSLQRANPGVPRSELVAGMLEKSGSRLPSHMSERDFRKADIRVSLDSSITSYFRQWKPTAEVSIGRGMVAMPALPLRTRIGGFSGRFDGEKLAVDTLAVKCGTSDLSASGELAGLGRTLSGMRGSRYRASLEVKSRRINLNEIIAAMQIAQTVGIDTAAVSEEDESFVIDSLADVVPDSTKLKLFIVPGNIDASVCVSADEVDYTDIKVTPAHFDVNMAERVVQIADADLNTELGNIRLDAYYATRTKKDISAGIDLRLSDVSAEGIIHILPTVDSLMPVLKSFKGDLGCEVTATTQLDTNMNVLMPTLDGVIRIDGQHLRVDDAGDLRKITRLLMFKNKNIGDIDDLYVDAVVHDNKLEVFPFVLGVDRYTLALYGTQGFDKSMNYQVSLLKSPFLLRFGINLHGSLDDWRYSLTRAKYRGNNVPAFSQTLDSLQINLGESIRNVCRRGVDEVRKYNERSMAALENRKAELNYSADAPVEALSEEETAKLSEEMKEEEDGSESKDNTETE